MCIHAYKIFLKIICYMYIQQCTCTGSTWGVGVVLGVANLLSTAVPKADHGLVNILVKHFIKLRTKLINS